MVAINSILVIVDPTASRHPSIEKAARLAQKCGARVELFACETHESRQARYIAHVAQGTKAPFIASVEALLEPHANALRTSGIDVCTGAAYGDPLHVQLLERVQRTCADLVVKDTHHHSLAKRTFITNTDWQLIRGCPVPLLLTKPQPWHDTPLIVAAVDPEHMNDKPAVLDHRVIDWARLVSTKLGGYLHLLHAYVPIILATDVAAGVPGIAGSMTAEMLDELRDSHQALLDDLARPYDIAGERKHLQMGAASYVLPHVARDLSADVLVMGAISRSGLQKIFIGSTAEKVLEHAPCDVLVVKSPDFSSTLPF